MLPRVCTVEPECTLGQRHHSEAHTMSMNGGPTPIISVRAFVDWNSQLLLTGVDADEAPMEATERALRMTTRRISQCLADREPNRNFRVELRLYHGWHKGYEPTARRRAASTVLSRTDFAALSSKPSVVYSPNVAYGDHLLHALSRRLHSKLGIHLPNTYRHRHGVVWEEKMVDTALASDVVLAAHQDPNEWIVVVTEDDDLIPSVFVAEAVLSTTGSRAILIRKRNQAGLMLLDDLLASY